MANKIIAAIFLLFVFAWQAHAAVTCTTAGRFADPSDTTCQNYTFCVLQTATNTYVAYNYTCPTTSVFNPTTSQCTAPTNYVCNVTINEPSNNTTSNSTNVCTADGFVADPSSTNCSSYIQCVLINETFVETPLYCPDGTFYNPDTTFCEPDYSCPSSNKIPFTCTAAGRFANSTDTTCQTYFYCVMLNSSTYTQYNYTCPSSSVFNPTTSQCTAPTNYVCNITTNEPSNNTTSNSTTSVCTADGFVADPSSANCTTYIQCVLINETFVETPLYCPDSTFYNPNTTFCEPDYNCTTSDTTQFTCKAAGRFANSTDTTCQTYFYCVLLSTGAYNQYNYTCPGTSVFNPTSAVCTTSYNCAG